MDKSKIIYYPTLDDINFNKIISNKKEFAQYSSKSLNDRTINDLCNAENFISRPIQRLLQSFISPNTPYNSLFLYHTVGSGKTCTSILIAQQFLDYLLKYNKHVHIIAPPAIQSNFSDTIFDFNKDIYKLNNNRTTQCTNYMYVDIWNKYLKEYNNNIEKTERAMKAYKNIRFTQHGYISFNNAITAKNGEFISPEDIKELYSNSIFIIDEVHLIREEGNNFKGFEYLFTHVENCKLLLLTATPMFNEPTQIIDILNLLLLNDKRPTIKDSDIFDKDYNIINRDLLVKITTGYISYIKTINPISFPIKLYPEDSKYVTLNKDQTNIEYISDKLGYNIIPCEISKEHFNIINKLNLNDLIPASQANTIIFPTNTYGDKGFNECFTYNKNTEKYTYNLFPGFLKENIIQQYSSKLYRLIQEIKSSNGKLFIFSQFIKPGAYLIGMLLEEMGYNRKILVNNKLVISNLLKTNNKDNKSYILITGEDQNKISKYVKHYNNDNNINGDNIQIIIGSRVIEQGINLFNLREIHLIDPWWNYSRITQIIGRGFRDCAHQNLPPQKRNITIYNYISTYKNELTQDIRQVISLLKKQKTINAVSKVLKQNAIDCNFNKEININKNFKKIEMINSKNKTLIVDPNDINYSLDCDYDICEYTCEYDLSSDKDSKLDESTYEFFNDSISNINIVKIWIKQLFEIKIIYKYEEIENILLQQDKYLTKDAIYIGLATLINNKETLYDKFNRPGYLINKQLYYIFQPNDIIDENIPLYLRELPLKERIYSISNLYNIKPSNLELLTTTTNTPDNLSSNLFYKQIVSNLNKYFPSNSSYNNISIDQLIKLFIQHDNLYDIIQEVILQNKSRYYIKLINTFDNEVIDNKWIYIKKFYEFELINTEYKHLLLLYLVIKSINKIPLNKLDEIMIKYYNDILIRNNNKDIIGFILYTHNPNYINEIKNNIDAYTEIPLINIYINNEWYLNYNINDINNILYDISPYIKNLQKNYNIMISSIKYNIIYNKQIVGIIGKSQSEDISVFKIIKFIDQISINKKEKLTNITISNIKDLQETVLIEIVKILINNINELNENYSYNIEPIQTIFNNYIKSSHIKKSNYISLILFVLYDLDKTNFGNRRWLISSYEASILKKNTLLEVSRTEKENISLSIHKGLLV